MNDEFDDILEDYNDILKDIPEEEIKKAKKQAIQDIKEETGSDETSI